jgi:DNA (cytosine-5)-methyltransferase 1
VFDQAERKSQTIESLLDLLTRWNIGQPPGAKTKSPNLDALAVVSHALHFARAFPKKPNPYRDGLSQLTGPLADGLLMTMPDEWAIPFPPVKKPKFTFIDLFAGIGGMRLGFQDPSVGGACVYSSEWDLHARHTYFANFGEVPFGDITSPDNFGLIPEHDVLVAGFPCQAFSIAGQRKGFEDTRGTMFFHVAEALKIYRPSAFLLENVKGLVSHRGGKTLKRILEILRDELHYHVPDHQILNAKNFGVPQNRERIFIVGFKTAAAAKRFKYPEPLPESHRMVVEDIIEPNPVDARYYLSTQYLKTLREHRARHEAAGNGFGFEIIDRGSIANAIVVGGMGRERNLVIDKRLSDFTPTTNIKGKINREGIRKMTPWEWARLQGFDTSKFIIPVKDAQAYKQFGNSVAVPVVRAVAKNIVRAMDAS